MSADCDAGSREHCITCADEGIPMQVVALSVGAGVCVDRGGVEHTVATDLIEPVLVGDEVLVHAGVAIANLGAGG
jgi:hydrogenase assembly chaperone HypC/HupF